MQMIDLKGYRNIRAERQGVDSKVGMHTHTRTHIHTQKKINIR